MADAAYKVSLFFEQAGERSAGWSESWYTTQSNLLLLTGPKDNPSSGIGWKLALASSAIHGRTSVCKYFRCTSVFTPRQSRIVQTRWQYNGEVSTAEIYESDQQSTAFNYRLFGGLGKVADHQIRGIPDGVVGNNGRFVYAGGMQQRAQAFFTFLQQNAFVIRFKDETQPKLLPENISQTGLVTITGHPYQTNDYVRVGLVRGIEQANGIWRINKVNADTFQLRFFVATTATLQKSNSAYVQKIVYDSVSPDDWDITFATSRKVGKPTRVRSGRLKRRVI